VARNAGRMFGHTFRGSTLATWLGIESERRAFERYRAMRQRERDYLPTVALNPAARGARAPSA
jgi:hypothetical protein